MVGPVAERGRAVGHEQVPTVPAQPDLFAAPIVRLRDGGSAIIGFRNLEPRGGDGFEIIDPIAVTLDAEGYLVARQPSSVGSPRSIGAERRTSWGD